LKNKIWFLGSSNVDITYRVKEIPLVGYTIQAKSYVIATGGKGANQAIAASKYGANVNFIGAVGDDSNGKILLKVLKTNGINVENVTIVKNVHSGNAVILVDDGGSNCIIVYPGANHNVPVDIYPDFMEGDMLVAQLEVNMSAVEYYFKLAKKAKKKIYTILNPSPFISLSQELLKKTDIIVVNEVEAYELGGVVVRGPETAKVCYKKIIKLVPTIVIITLGKMGVVVATNENAFHVPGYDVDVVDTQGAGDAFLGTFVAKLAQGATIEDATLFANMVAALSGTKMGSTQVSLPEPEEVVGRNPGRCIKL